MIDQSIKTALLEKHGELNFKGLLDFMESTGIDYLSHGLDRIFGMATCYGIYLDLNKIDEYHDKFLFFIILHETAHYKRIEQMGGKDAMIKILSTEDFEEFCGHVIGEEIFADRYACFVYQILNNETFPREATQKLHIKEVQERYKHSSAIRLFGVVKNSEEIYKQLVESFLV
jgi:hypothetical protein